jgi:predicted secreted Zn-dependent protease
MDRSCSWWNPKDIGLPADYILQHEQIHFALTELAARDATARVKSITGKGRTPQAAADDFQARVARLMHEIVSELKERSTQFDEATSGRYAPEAQEGWWRRVASELGGDE